MNNHLVSCLVLLFLSLSLGAQKNYSIALYGGPFNEGVTHNNEDLFTINNQLGFFFGGGFYHQPSNRFELFATAQHQINSLEVKIEDCACAYSFFTGNPIIFSFGVNYKPILLGDKSYVSLGGGYSLASFINGSSVGAQSNTNLYNYNYRIDVNLASTYGMFFVNGEYNYAVSDLLRFFGTVKLTTELHARDRADIQVRYESANGDIQFNKREWLNFTNLYFTLGLKYNIFGSNFPKRK